MAQARDAQGDHPRAPRRRDRRRGPGYATISDIPDGDVKVIDLFVSSEHVGAVVDEAIAHKDRLQIDAIWMQLGVVDPAAADRAREAGLLVVMDTCPKIEWRQLRNEGASR